jgi:hypothetical protein
VIVLGIRTEGLYGEISPMDFDNAVCTRGDLKELDGGYRIKSIVPSFAAIRQEPKPEEIGPVVVFDRDAVKINLNGTK